MSSTASLPATSPSSGDVWADVVTVGLLGTDRRDPPELPPGPVADLVADAVRPTPSARLLTTVAALVAARRSGARALPSRPPLVAPPPDDRPLLPAVAADRWRDVITNWPILEAEWLRVATAAGWRPSADVLVALLRRHRHADALSAPVAELAGPLAAWLVDHLPELARGPARPARPGRAARAARPGDERVLPVPADLQPLLDGPPEALAEALVTGLDNGTFRWAHRGVLLNLVATAPPGALAAMISALVDARATAERDGRVRSPATGEMRAPLALWESLIELAAVRRHMLDELELQ